MPFVLTTDDAVDGTAYWAPAAPGGLEFWSENGSGDLYPNTNNAQDLGLAGTNVIDQVFGQRIALGTANGSLVTVHAPGLGIGTTQGAGGIVANQSIVAGQTYAVAGTLGFLIATTQSLTLGAVSAPFAGLTATIQAAEQSESSGFVFGRGSISSQAQSRAAGQVLGYDPGSIVATQQSQAFGRVFESTITAGASSLALGTALGGGLITADNTSRVSGYSFGGTLAAGYSDVHGFTFNDGTVSGYGYGSRAHGSASSYGLITTGGDGTSAWGHSRNYSGISSSGSGSVAFGDANFDADIISSGPGSAAWGQAQDGTAIVAAAAGSIAFGMATSFGSNIGAGANGAFAGGETAAGYGISATGAGSMAFGAAVTGIISASAVSAIQFGEGTNSVARSLKVGDDVYGLRLIGSGASSTRVGDFWSDGVDVFVRTGGVTKSLSDIP